MNTKTKNIALIVSAYLISVTCTQIFIYGLMFYNRALSSQSTASWAMIFASFLFPGALTNIFVGVLSDMSSKQKLMIRSEFISGVFTLLFLYTFSLGFDSLIYLCSYAAILSITFSFFEVPLDASMVNIAGDKANSLVSVIWLARALAYCTGPILGRVLSANPSMLFYLNAASFLISILLQSFMTLDEKINKKVKLSVGVFLKSVGSELTVLKKYMKENRIVGFLLLLNLVIALVYMPVFSAVIPDLAKQLSLEEKYLSYLESSSWIGVALAAVFVSATNVSSFLLKNLFNTLKLQSVMFFLWLFPLFFNFRNTEITVILLVLVILDGVINTSQTLGALTYFQVQIPENVRGKLLGTMRTVMKITAPIGIFVYGLALKYVPWYAMLLFTAVVMFAISTIMGMSKTFQDFKKKMIK
jgi:DHA3 family macrolide efflux protein-like MFS transporter